MKTKLIIVGIAGMTALMLPSVAFANADKYDTFIKQEANETGIPFTIIKGLIAAESSFNPNAKAGTTSATGLMQMTKAAASDVGYSHSDMTDPQKAIAAGAAYLARHVKVNGLFGGIRSYYMGGGNYRKMGKTGEIETLEAESYKYLAKVLGYSMAFAMDLKTWI